MVQKGLKMHEKRQKIEFLGSLREAVKDYLADFFR